MVTREKQMIFTKPIGTIYEDKENKLAILIETDKVKPLAIHEDYGTIRLGGQWYIARNDILKEKAGTVIKLTLQCLASRGVKPQTTPEPPNDFDIVIYGAQSRRFSVTKENKSDSGKSDGSTASYYQLPQGAKELQDLISNRNMNAQLGEIFRACYRFGMASHSDQLRDAKKIKFYIEAEIKRLEGNGN